MEFYGLIGEKLGHSLSEPIHRMAFERLGVEGAYKLIEIPRGQLDQLAGAMRLLGIKGLNVTIPYKQMVMDQLDWIDPQAHRVGAVNTLCLSEGLICGYNTDVMGLRAMLDRNGVRLAGRSAVVLGTGGVAKAAAEVLLSGGVSRLTLVSRRPEAVQPADARINLVDYGDLNALSGHLLVNCTPMGMFPGPAVSPVDQGVVARFDVLVDTIYNPAETEFLRMGRACHKQVMNGLYMLVAQAMAAQSIWQGREVPDSVTEEIYEALRRRAEGGTACLPR